MSKHTPEPWTVSSLQPFYVVGPASSKFEVVCAVAEWKDSNPDNFTPSLIFENANSNARLIAAAPELLEALKDMAAWSEGCVKVMEMDGNKTLATGLEMRRRIALQVIAKATGKP